MQGHPIRQLIANRAPARAIAQHQPAEPMSGWLNLFLGFDGRLSRADFRIASLVLAAALLVFWIFASFLAPMAQDFAMGVAYAALIYPAAALISKRLQDRGKRFAWIGLFLGLPVFFSIFNMFAPDPSNPLAILLSTLYLPVMIWALIELWFLRGTAGVNAFGANPGDAD